MRMAIPPITTNVKNLIGYRKLSNQTKKWQKTWWRSRSWQMQDCSIPVREKHIDIGDPAIKRERFRSH